MDKEAVFKEIEKFFSLNESVKVFFSTYISLLLKWQNTINLIGKGTVDDVWSRHVLDSAQLYSLLPSDSAEILDLGSGAGFPGLILAGMDQKSGKKKYVVHLIESDSRKCAFLREVARVCGLSVNVLCKRIEEVPVFKADIIMARALADVNKLLTYAEPFIKTNTECLFLKGKNYQTELTEALKFWKFKEKVVPSVVESEGVILSIKGVEKNGTNN